MTVRQRAIFAVIICLMTVALFGQARAEDRKILGVQVSPDLKRITIKCDGPAGRPSSFIIRHPYRLVLDMQSTALGSIPRKISVDRDPIREIRLGFLNERARVVIDFGDNVVPPFKIENVNNDIVVNLDRGATGAFSKGRHAPVSGSTAQSGPSKIPEAGRTHPRSHAARIAVKHSRVVNNKLYVDLINRNEPKMSYKLAINLDPKAMAPTNATLTDLKGNKRKFKISATTQTVPDAPSNHVKSLVGPRKEPAGPETSEADNKKFKWGAQSAGSKGSVSRGDVHFHIENYQLEKRKNLAAGN
jgi:AMIN domain